MLVNDSTAVLNGIYQRNSCYPLQSYPFNNFITNSNHNTKQNDISIPASTNDHITVTDLDFFNQASKMVNNYNQPDRVTMKIDVSYTDHSHVIGKGGQSIKSIMTDTECHIHFPDSNRTNTIEKSNQVSISGLPIGVEMARQKIRAILPLIYSFDNPYVPYNVLEQQDKNLIANLQRMLEVSISYRPMGKVVNGTTIYVKGIVMKYKQTIRAVNIILTHHFGQNIEQIPVMMTIEIDPKHHSFLLNQGRQNSLGSEIFKLTGATINFPDNTFTSAHAALAASNPMGISGLFKKSTVSIWGTAESTFEARQQLISRLPVILMYDITIEEGVNLEMFNLNSINEAYDVSISIKLKLKQSTKSVIIRTTEQNVQALFEVKKILNKLRQQFKPIINSGMKTISQVQLTKLNGSIDMKLPQNQNNNTNNITSTNTINQGKSTMSSPNLMTSIPTKHPISNYHLTTTYTTNNVLLEQQHRPNFVFTALGQTQSSASSSPSTISNKYSATNNSQTPNNSTQPFTPISFNTQHNSNRTDVFIPITEDKFNNPQMSEINQTNSMIKPSAEPLEVVLTAQSDSNNHVRQDSRSSESSPNHLLNTPSSISTVASCYHDWRAPGAEYSAKQREMKHRSNNESPIQSIDDISNRCSELFISNSSEPKDSKENFSTKFVDISKFNQNNSNLYSTANNITNSAKFCDVIQLLESLNLERYIDHFINNEIDMNTLSSLNEDDLKELGIIALGARRKIMMAIYEINNSKRSS